MGRRKYVSKRTDWGVHTRSGEHQVPYRETATQAAKELGYSEEVIELIKYAKTDEEISRIMATARNGGKF